MSVEELAAHNVGTRAAGVHHDAQVQGKSSGAWQCALGDAALAKAHSAHITIWKDVRIVRTTSGGSTVSGQRHLHKRKSRTNTDEQL